MTVAGAPPRVLGDVRQRLGDDEVGGGLDHRREARRAAARRPSTGIGERRPSASTAATRPRSASTGGAIPRARSRSSAIAAPASSRACAHELGDLGTVVEPLLGAADQHRQRDEPRLRAVVEVALDAPQLRGLHVERAAPRARQLVDAAHEALLAHPGQLVAVSDPGARSAEADRHAEDRPDRPEVAEAGQRPDDHADRADRHADGRSAPRAGARAGPARGRRSRARPVRSPGPSQTHAGQKVPKPVSAQSSAEDERGAGGDLARAPRRRPRCCAVARRRGRVARPGAGVRRPARPADRAAARPARPRRWSGTRASPTVSAAAGTASSGPANAFEQRVDAPDPEVGAVGQRPEPRRAGRASADRRRRRRRARGTPKTKPTTECRTSQAKSRQVCGSPSVAQTWPRTPGRARAVGAAQRPAERERGVAAVEVGAPP